MDSKQIIPLAIIFLCALSLFIGIFNSAINPQKRMTTPNILDGRIALIKLEGIIQSGQKDSFMQESYSAESTRKSLAKALDDPSVRGVLLRINSPGGTVAESQEIYNLVMKVRRKKPVFVSMTDVAASGGYYIASAADRIYADPGTLTGSIGVIFSSPDMSNLMQNKLGIKSQVIKSGKYKDIGSSARPMTEDEKTLLTDIIKNSYAQFLAAITKGRIERTDTYNSPKTNLTPENLKTYADGRIFTGEQAKSLGFVDELGGLDETYEALNKIISPHKKLPLTLYNKESGFAELFSNMQSSFAPQDLTKNLLPFNIKHSHTLLYIWE